jgi:hypothetical protein
VESTLLFLSNVHSAADHHGYFRINGKAANPFRGRGLAPADTRVSGVGEHHDSGKIRNLANELQVDTSPLN